MVFFHLTLVLVVSLLSLLHVPAYALPTVPNYAIHSDSTFPFGGDSAGNLNTEPSGKRSALQARQDQDPIILVGEAVCTAYDEWDRSSVPEYVLAMYRLGLETKCTSSISQQRLRSPSSPKPRQAQQQKQTGTYSAATYRQYAPVTSSHPPTPPASSSRAPRTTYTAQAADAYWDVRAVVEAARFEGDEIAAGMVATVGMNVSAGVASATLMGVQEGVTGAGAPSRLANFTSLSQGGINTVGTMREWAEGARAV
ncbi:uncharacterized protein DSM5745_02426 [Aspergillus mulundensis]|uniref:Uncharacterized protein n=1 Tax=Aspergillus mulundensis TaxID=1810919 RepID=A0A3D8SWV8_9EURO|nr:hypothetical protein DSM5745_02426 [Aspergillus mulundensis]RDW90651.1 hypothetical protein DSM5745_02426 [Aspergillus mulundensis]